VRGADVRRAVAAQPERPSFPELASMNRLQGFALMYCDVCERILGTGWCAPCIKEKDFPSDAGRRVRATKHPRSPEAQAVPKQTIKNMRAASSKAAVTLGLQPGYLEGVARDAACRLADTAAAWEAGLQAAEAAFDMAAEAAAQTAAAVAAARIASKPVQQSKPNMTAAQLRARRELLVPTVPPRRLLEEFDFDESTSVPRAPEPPAPSPPVLATVAVQSAATPFTAALVTSESAVGAAAPTCPAREVPAPPAVSVASSSKKSSGAPDRVTSSRKNEAGSNCTHAQLLVMVRTLNAKLPKDMQAKNLKQMKIPDLDAFLDAQDVRIQTASLDATFASARLRLTQAVSRDICIRMLTLIAKVPGLADLYQDSCGGTNRTQLDAGHKPLVNPGQGMGLNHLYHVKMHEAFHNQELVFDFPFEYIPSVTEPAWQGDRAGQTAESPVMASDGTTFVQTPLRIRDGLFAGLGIRQALFPQGFPATYFDIDRLNTIFQNGLSEYQNAMTNFHKSGQHGFPLWFFVGPCKTTLPEDQEQWLDFATKRWDTLAFHMMVESLQCLRATMVKNVPNGKGGPEPASLPAVALPGAPPRHVLNIERQAAAVRANEQLQMQRELHELQVGAMRNKQRLQLGSEATAIMQKIRELIVLKNAFTTLPATDMADIAQADIDALKSQLIKTERPQPSATLRSDSSVDAFNTPQAGMNESTPRTAPGTRFPVFPRLQQGPTP